MMISTMIKMMKGNRLKTPPPLAFGNSFTGSFIFATDRFADQIDACRQPSLIIASPK